MTDTLPYVPDIAIASYLGKTREMREYRLAQHLKQRTLLLGFFPKQKIITVASDYSRAERKVMKDMELECHHLDEPTLAWKKHDLILRTLYASKTPKATLILDDDCVPRASKPDDMENGLVDTAKLVKFWLQEPAQIPAPLVFFACQGLKFDAYYRSEPTIIGRAPIMVTGWCFLVRSDLGVYQPGEEFANPRTGKYIAHDFPFRVKCEGEGKPVVKHYRAFFKSLQGSGDDQKKSTCYPDREERNRDIAEVLRMLRAKYPDVFNKGKKKPVANRGPGLFGGGK